MMFTALVMALLVCLSQHFDVCQAGACGRHARWRQEAREVAESGRSGGEDSAVSLNSLVGRLLLPDQAGVEAPRVRHFKGKCLRWMIVGVLFLFSLR